jgi:mannosyltransferase OCH1-like enzyme
MKRPRNFSLLLVAFLFFAFTIWRLTPEHDHDSIRSRSEFDKYYLWATHFPQGNIRQRLAEYVPYDPNRRWERNLIQIWHTEVNSTNNLYFSTWEEHLSDFKHILYINNSTQKEYIESIEKDTDLLYDVVRAYLDLLDMTILRADFFRYIAIFIQGGVYADIDAYATQPFNNWLANVGYIEPEFVPPIEELERQIGMVIAIEGGKAHNWWGIEQFMFGAKPGHPLLLEIIARIVEKAGVLYRKIAEGKIREADVLAETGPGIMTKVVEEYIKTHYDASFNYRYDLELMDDIGAPILFGDILILPPVAVDGYPAGKPRHPGVYCGHSALSSWRFESHN